MILKVKKLNENAVLPTKGSKNAAGADLYACIEAGAVNIAPGETVKIGTGIAVEIPEDFFGAIYARSGLATKRGLRPGNCVGVADADYRGEICVALHNDSNECQTVHDGDRIAQMVVQPCMPLDIREVDELSDSERGTGGFGSTGTR